MFHFVQRKVLGDNRVDSWIQRYKKETEKWEDKVKKKEEVVKKLEKKREQYEGDP